MALRLVAELRSGYHKQTKNILHDAETNRKCCLGVACWMKYQNIYSTAIWNGRVRYSHQDTSMDDITIDQFGFYDSMGSRRDGERLIIGQGAYESLAMANDNGCSFEEIADYIEANWESL